MDSVEVQVSFSPSMRFLPVNDIESLWKPCSIRNIWQEESGFICERYCQYFKSVGAIRLFSYEARFTNKEIMYRYKSLVFLLLVPMRMFLSIVGDLSCTPLSFLTVVKLCKIFIWTDISF